MREHGKRPRLSAELLLVALAVIAAGAGASAQSGCAPSTPPVPLQPVLPAPIGPAMEAWVDPVHGDDGSGSVGGQPFKTIQAAVDGLALWVIQNPTSSGIVKLLPGLYGAQANGPTHNGEIWPVVVPPRISIVGHSALNVMLDGRSMPPVSGYEIPDPASGQLVSARPVLVFGGPWHYGYTDSLVSRITIVGADVGILVTGQGEVDPTVAQVLFTQCRVGVQVHSSGSSEQGVHKPRLLWCTLGSNQTGVAVSGAPQVGGRWAGRSRPAVVNSLFVNTADLEGVPCQAVLKSAFAPGASNQSPHLGQPDAGQMPAPVFDPSSYTLADLFVGALTLPPSLSGPPFFTDWRLSYRTMGPAWVQNPAIGTAHVAFPTTLDNGTAVHLVVGGIPVGAIGGEGNGVPGPVAPPGGSGGGPDLGYDPAGTFVVGGTMPLTNGYGVSFNGVLFNTLHLMLRDPPGYVTLWGVFPPSATIHQAGRNVCAGVLDPPLTFAGLNGAWYLDHQSYVLTDLTTLLGNGYYGNNGAGAHWTVPLLSPSMGRMDVVFQMFYVAASGALMLSEAQHVFVELDY